MHHETTKDNDKIIFYIVNSFELTAHVMQTKFCDSNVDK